MFCVYTEVMAQNIQLLLNKNTPHFQLLPMSKVLTSPDYAFMRHRLYSKRKSNNSFACWL